MVRLGPISRTRSRRTRGTWRSRPRSSLRRRNRHRSLHRAARNPRALRRANRSPTPRCKSHKARARMDREKENQGRKRPDRKARDRSNLARRRPESKDPDRRDLDRRPGRAGPAARMARPAPGPAEREGRPTRVPARALSRANPAPPPLDRMAKVTSPGLRIQADRQVPNRAARVAAVTSLAAGAGAMARAISEGAPPTTGGRPRLNRCKDETKESPRATESQDQGADSLAPDGQPQSNLNLRTLNEATAGRRQSQTARKGYGAIARTARTVLQEVREGQVGSGRTGAQYRFEGRRTDGCQALGQSVGA